MMFIHSRLLPLFLILFLSACGGGSGGGGSSADPDNNNGSGSSDTGGGNNNSGGTNPPPSGDIVVPTIPTSNQRIAARHYDFGSNGFIAVTERFTYDDKGRVTEIDFMLADGASGFPNDVLPFSFGGNQENRTRFTYDTNGQIESIEVETFDRDPTTGDRVLDRRSVFTFTWDDAAYVITEALAEFYDIGDGGALQSSV